MLENAKQPELRDGAKQYLVTESELQTITYFNSASTVCWSVGAFTISYPLRRPVEWISGGTPPEMVYYVLTVIALASFVVGWFFGRKQSSTFDIIKQETKHVAN